MTQLEYLITNLFNILVSVMGTRVTTAVTTLSGTATALPSFPCKSVTLLTSCSLTSGGGVPVTILPNTNIPCQDASQLLVSGSGTLNYLIFN